MNIREKSIVFIGFMGVGKTTIAQLVAQKLYRDFIDIDQEIEKDYQMPTSSIFQQYGEEQFRTEEKTYTFHYCKQPLKVIALGGGAFLQEEIRQHCIDHSIVFYLDISWESWKERLHMLVDSRPVLQNKSMEEIETLFQERKAIYNEHNSRFVIDDTKAEEVADYIIQSLKLAWDIYS